MKTNLSASLDPTGAAGGDLTGTYPDPVVNTVNGVTSAYYDPTSSIQTQLNEKIERGDYTYVMVSSIATLQSFNGPETKILVTDANQGGEFYYTTSSITADGGTIFTATGKGSGFWVRQYSGALNVKWFGAKGDCSADDWPAFNSAINSLVVSGKTNIKVYIPPSTYCLSQALVPASAVHLYGDDGYDMYPSGYTPTVLKFADGVTGISSTIANAAGSIYEGFGITSVSGALGGRLMDFNTINNTVLYIPGSKSPTVNTTYDIRDPFSTDTVKGTMTFNNTAIITVNKLIQFTSPTGIYVLGETITGATSGATATVQFVSQIFNCIGFTSISGTFTVGETINGGSSGTTAVCGNLTNLNVAFKVAQTSTITGIINGLDFLGNRINIFNNTGSYAHGILCTYRATFIDIVVNGFSGNGIMVAAPYLGVGNANLTKFTRIKSNGNGYNGIYVVGGDVNKMTVSQSSCQINNGYAIVDNSFLGNTYNDPHSAGNLAGGYTGGYGINNKTIWSNPYTEAYAIVTPYQPLQNTFGGGNQVLGGVTGLPNNMNAQGANSTGILFDQENIFNRRVRVALNPATNNPTTIFRSTNGIAVGEMNSPLAVELPSNAGVGRGVGIKFLGPYGAGADKTGQSKLTSYEYANLRTSILISPTRYYLQSLVKRNPPPNLTITGIGGSGAILVPEVLGGTVISITVLATGINYPLNTTIVTLTGGMTSAVLSPVVQDGSIISVTVVSGGSGYADTDMVPVVEALSNALAFRPSSPNTTVLGESTQRWSTIYGNTLNIVNPLAVNMGGLNTTTAPSIGQIPIATSASAYAPITVSGDITNSAGVFTVGTNKITYAKMQAITPNKLLGSGLTGSSVSEITLGTGLSFTGTTLNSTGSGLNKLTGYTVATLPAGTIGMVAYVTDAVAPTYLGTLTGGGSVVTPVFYNGTVWVAH